MPDSSTKRPPGRPTKYRPEMCDTVVEMMAEGCSKIEVCAALGISEDTLYRWAGEDDKPAFSEAIKQGERLSHAWWLSEGRQALRDKDFNHALWYMNMKNRHGWRDRTEHSGDPKNPVQVVMSSTDADL